jgi:hypothetical protein
MINDNIETKMFPQSYLILSLCFDFLVILYICVHAPLYNNIFSIRLSLLWYSLFSSFLCFFFISTIQKKKDKGRSVLSDRGRGRLTTLCSLFIQTHALPLSLSPFNCRQPFFLSFFLATSGLHIFP